MMPSYGGARTERILSELQALGFGEPGSHTSLWCVFHMSRDCCKRPPSAFVSSHSFLPSLNSRLMPMILRLPPISETEKGDDTIKARMTVNQVDCIFVAPSLVERAVSLDVLCHLALPS